MPAGRILGIDVRLHWTLLAYTAFQVSEFAGTGASWYWWPVVLLAVPLSVLLHEFGHSLTARAVGGDSRNIILWAFGGIAWCSVPARILAHLLVAAGGPMVNLILWGAGTGLLHSDWVDGPLAGVIGFIAGVNGMLLLFNLLPCYPMDGGRIARSLLWPVVGRAKAVRWTIVLAWICLAGMAAWAVMNRDFFLFTLAAVLAFAVVGEQRAVAAGYDPEGIEEWQAGRPLLEGWSRRREARAAARVEAKAAAEQAELDRLLAKVSEHGLPALSQSERRTLQRISERERERAGR